MLVYGQEKYSSANSLEGSIAFMIEQIMNRVNVCTPVQIVDVHTEGPFGVVGTVDVKPLIDQQTVLGELVEHTVIYGIPYIRLQGGASAFIADPVVGDLGICIFADRDISSFKETGLEGVPPTFRTYDMADGIYIGGWNRNIDPVRYVAVNVEGITEQAGPSGVLTQDALNIITTVTGLWNQILNNVTVQAQAFTITVPEFAIQGNLSVSGIVHCTWQGNLIDISYGGTGSNLSSTGGPNMVLAQLTPGAPVTVEVRNTGERPLEHDEPFRLHAPGRTCRWRHAVLQIDGQAAATVTLVWLPDRLPGEVCAELDAGQRPFGAILAPYKMKRIDRLAHASQTGLMDETTGEPIAVQASAVVVVSGLRVAITEELILERFARALVGAPLPGTTGLG